MEGCGGGNGVSGAGSSGLYEVCALVEILSCGRVGGMNVLIISAATIICTDWLACSSAAAKAFTLGKRSSGSLLSALSTTCSTSLGKSGTCVRSD